ncbi:hypothetical protein [Rhodoferax sp.]|uniref:hypothetical protein n=1 Tax=Rhodoferax sp. TaxID=50421 RepID=UPI00374D89F2
MSNILHQSAAMAVFRFSQVFKLHAQTQYGTSLMLIKEYRFPKELHHVRVLRRSVDLTAGFKEDWIHAVRGDFPPQHG